MIRLLFNLTNAKLVIDDNIKNLNQLQYLQSMKFI